MPPCTLVPRLARAASTSLRLASTQVHARTPPLVGCSHWVRAYAAPSTTQFKAAKAAAMGADFEILDDAEVVVEEAADVAEVDFCDDVEFEWEGEEVQDGVFVSLPDAGFTHARHAAKAQAQAQAAEVEAEAKPSPAATRQVPTSIKQMNRLLSRHSVPDLPESELDEKFVRGRGPGGQAINKTNSSVCLTHLPTGIRVQAQPTRSREQNRYVARQILKDRLDLMRARGELPNPDGTQKPKAEMNRKEKLAAEARTWSKQELRWEKERRRKLNRKKKVNKRKKAEEGEEDGEA